MHSVLTLIANPAKPCLDQDLIGKILRILKDDHQTGVTGTEVLAEGIAVDLFLEGTAQPGLASAVASTIEASIDVCIDVCCQPVQGREKKLLVADMDSTIIEQECLDELADFAGLKAEISAITERAMQGELDFEAALKERVSMLKGLPVSTLQETLETRLTLTAGAVELVRTMNARGAMTALVSGGFTYFTHRIAQATGFQENQGNVLELDGGKLTGQVEEPILGREAKREALLTFCDFNGLAPEEALAVGDGANDLAMLEIAGSGVAFHAKPAVAKQAGFCINHGDLTALLYLQGIPQAEFVTA